MIISKYNKSYDTADGSEQQYEDPRQFRADDVDAEGVTHPASEGTQGAKTAGSGSAGERWEDNGAPLRIQPLQPPISPLEFSHKPSWSVQSLRDLNEAVRLGDWPDNPAHLRRRAEEAQQAKVTSAEDEAQRAASHAHAERHRDRNPWEHT